VTVPLNLARFQGLSTITVRIYIYLAGGNVDLDNFQLNGGTVATTTAPYIVAASTTNVTQVNVQFSKAMDPTTAQNIANYSLDHGATIASATLQTDGHTVVLVPASAFLHNTTYNLTVTNVQDTTALVISPNPTTIPFLVPAAVAPTIATATTSGNFNISIVTITFSKPINTATASNASSYALNNGATVLSVSNVTSTSATLNTSILLHGIAYTLTGNGIQDFDTPPNVMTNSTTPFIVPAAVLTTLTSAAAIDSTHVQATFSKALATATANNATHYTIAGIAVTGASLAADNVTVTLTVSTLTKNVTYTLSVANVTDTETPPNAIAAGATKSFTLLDIPGANLYWWLKADANVTLNGANVSIWGDSSVNNWPANQATAANQPGFVASNPAVNNKPTVHFNGTTAYLATANTAVPLTGKTNLTIFAVASSADATTTVTGTYGYGEQNTMVHFIQNNGAWGNGIFSVFEQGVNVWYAAGQAHPNTLWSRTATSAWMIYDSTRDQTGTGLETLRVNGVSVATNSAGTAAIWAEDGGVNVGAWAAGSYWAGDIAEIIIYTRALSDSERQAVEQYLQAKYFVAQPAPTVAITSPTSTYTATLGSTVNFTAAVTVTNTNPGVTISSVLFYDGPTLLGAGISAGGGNYTFAWNTAGQALGLHNVTAIATDSASTPATSAAVAVLLSNTTAPSVTLRAPASGLIAGQGWLIALSATTTNGTPNVVTGVDFYLDGVTQVGHGTLVSPGVYSATWDSTTAPFGPNSLLAKVTDSGGLTGSSNSVSLVIRIPGDGNGDNIVDGEDYGIWQNGYNHPGATMNTGDYNGDSIVDGEDYGVWQNNYNRTAGLEDVVAASSADVASTPMVGSAAPKLVSVTPTASTVALVFDTDVVVGGSAVEVTGLVSGPQAYTAAYDAATKTLTLTFASGLPADSYTVRVIGSFVVAADGGASLAGDAQAQFSQE
jgi:hypothetical protein